MEAAVARSVTARFALIINGPRAAVAALILAGKLLAERAYRARATIPPAPTPPDPDAAPRPWPMWRWLSTWRSGWLCWVAPSRPSQIGAACFGEGLRSLLGEPDMAALIAATRRMAKLLRPLCWALKIEGLPPRPARAKRVVVDAASAAIGTECDGVASRVVMAMTPVRASASPPADTRTVLAPRPEFFARA